MLKGEEKSTAGEPQASRRIGGFLFVGKENQVLYVTLNPAHWPAPLPCA
jgi:hypothetical protein